MWDYQNVICPKLSTFLKYFELYLHLFMLKKSCHYVKIEHDFESHQRLAHVKLGSYEIKFMILERQCIYFLYSELEIRLLFFFSLSGDEESRFVLKFLTLINEIKTTM